jgi:hypothetical protein
MGDRALCPPGIAVLRGCHLLEMIVAFVKVAVCRDIVAIVHGRARFVGLDVIAAPDVKCLVNINTTLIVKFGIYNNLTILIALAATGIVIHFLCGHIGGNVSLFVADGDTLTEEKRECGRISPIVRNILQFAVVGGIGYMITLTNEIAPLLKTLLGSQAADLMAQPFNLIPGAIQLLSLIFFSSSVASLSSTMRRSVPFLSRLI